jgi:threonylcarbamoyladenosine tRNA methylthiotransferase MtaB
MTPGGTAAFHTLGCKLNFSESSTLAKQLLESGFARVTIDDCPDVVVINTCSVTEQADAKCRHAVRRALNSNPEAFVVVIGCYAQLKPQEIAQIKGVDLVLGAEEKFNLLKHLDSLQKKNVSAIEVSPIKNVKKFVPSFSSGDRTRTFLKVQDGCDYFCAFCTIPLARGRSRSASIEETLLQAQKAVEAGAKEIVLTGVNIGDFGKAHGSTFLDLLQALDEQVTVPRFRISSIEPNLLSDDIIDFVSQSQRFQPHFHIPLQSGSDAMLKSMRRRYRTAEYVDRIGRIRQQMPMASIGVDVITGFHGETDHYFKETQDFLAALPISYLHVFTYSERAKTTALRLDNAVPVAVRKQRTKQLRMLSLKKQRAHYEQFIDCDRPVLFEESTEDGLRFGFTPEYVRIAVDSKSIQANTIEKIKLKTIKAAGYIAGETLAVSTSLF